MERIENCVLTGEALEPLAEEDSGLQRSTIKLA